MKKLGILGMSFALLSLVGALSFSTNTDIVKASGNHTLTQSIAVDTNAEEISDDDLSVKITQSTYTSNSQYYNINFSTSYSLYKAGRQYTILYDITDPAFDTENLPKRPEDDPATEDVNENETYEMPIFEGAVYSIDAITNDTIVIPSFITVNKNFQIKITSIPSNVFSANILKKGVDKIKNIYLPETAKLVSSDAFVGIKEQTKIYVPIQDSEDPCEFGENWTTYLDNVIYDFDYSASENASIVSLGEKNSNTSGTVSKSNDLSFTIGYIDKENPANSKPLIIAYDVISGSNRETRTQELPMISTNNNYEIVGKLGQKNYTKSISLMLNEGEIVDDASITLYNIYEAQMINNPNGEGNIIVPNGEQFKCSPRIAYSNRLSVNDFVDYEFVNLGSFANFTTITVKFDCKDEVYKENKTSSYEKEINNIESGKTYLRYRLTNLNLTYYNLTYLGNDGHTYNQKVKFDVKNSSAVIGKIGENNFTFLFNNDSFEHGLNAQAIKGISFDDLTFTIDLFTDTGKASNGSTLTATFASIMVINPTITNTSLNTYDLNFVSLLCLIIFLVIYIGGTVALFFINKERFKNDEFKRVVPARFFKRAAIIGVGLMIIMYALLFIISRFGIMANTTVVYNPIDIPIIVFSVLAILFIGYFVKELLAAYKNYKQNKERIRLNLDADKVDDGTN